MRLFSEFAQLKDRYFWLTAYIIAKNAIVREYHSSFLGIAWTVLMPLIQVVIYAIIMPMIMSRGVENYPLYLVASFPLWAFISNSLVQASNAIIFQAETIKRCMIPSVIFPITHVLKHFYTYFISFVTMYAFCVLTFASFDPIVLLLPFVLIPLFISVMAMSIAIAYFAPYVRDVSYMMHMTVNMIFWFTPVVYPLSVVPEKYRWVFELNPFYVLMRPAQMLIFDHRLPSLADMLGAGMVMLLSIFFGWMLYRMCRRNYVYYL